MRGFFRSTRYVRLQAAQFHFELSAPLIALVSALACGAGYYVNTQIKLAASRCVEKATDKIAARIEKISEQAMSKIDGLSAAINAVNLTITKSEERAAHYGNEVNRNTASIQKLHDRITTLERRES